MLAPRLWTPLLVIGFVMAFLVLPLTRHPKERGVARSDAAAVVARGADVARRAWSSGALAAGHDHLTDRCEACHVRAFEGVTDDACVGCHAGVGAHTASDVAHSTFAEIACTQCHHEHEGPTLSLRVEAKSCVECHAGIRSVHPEATVGDVSDFATDHPDLSIDVPLAIGSPRRTRLAASEARLPVEASGLTFNHVMHLQRNLRGADGPESLSCDSCHESDPGGVLMLAPRFDDHCRRCHRLGFAAEGTTTPSMPPFAPHAEPSVVHGYVRGYFMAAHESGGTGRARPGSHFERHTDDALRAAERAIDKLLGPQGVCADCHVVHDSGEHASIAPVHVVPYAGAPRWLSGAGFDHGAHVGLDCSSASPIHGACTCCHAATDSTSSADILIPAITTCRGCHGATGEGVSAASASCTECHDLHQRRYGPMRTAGRRPARPEDTR